MATSKKDNLINLKTLRRVDQHIVEILDNACQVAIYKYERKLGKWEGTDIEGALFLFRRSVYPHYGFIIVNRMSTENFIEILTNDMQIQLQEPYLLYQNKSGEIIGSWFYEQNELLRIAKKIQTLILKETSPPKRQRCASESDTQPQNVESGGQDIMTLLSQAHEEYMRKTNENSEDVNWLGTYTEKKTGNKSIEPAVKKQESIAGITRKYSCEESDPVSPRRRFMSTGSFDPDRANYLSRMFSTMHMTPTSTLEVKEDNTGKELLLIDTANDANKLPQKLKASPPKTISSFLSNVNFSTLSINPSTPNELFDSQVVSDSVERKDILNSPFQNNQDWKSAVNGDTTSHFSSIKDAIKTHIEENPKVMLKIHEAYVSSLKSLFTNSSC